jgi:beta-N-acetylhexosaminidase
MKALDQGPNQVLDVLAAGAGVDLLLLAADPVGRERVTYGLRHASRRRLLDSEGVRRSLCRFAELRRRLALLLGEGRPGLEVVGSEAHRALSREVAARSLTVVRDEARSLPLRLGPEERILVVMPRPVDLTPADTSSTVPPGLAAVLLATGRPVVTAALRTPWDLLAYPDARTHLCTYSVLPDSLEALASALVGRLDPSGKLPVPLGDLYPVGHGL